MIGKIPTVLPQLTSTYYKAVRHNWRALKTIASTNRYVFLAMDRASCSWRLLVSSSTMFQSSAEDSRWHPFHISYAAHREEEKSGSSRARTASNLSLPKTSLNCIFRSSATLEGQTENVTQFTICCKRLAWNVAWPKLRARTHPLDILPFLQRRLLI